MKPWAWRILLSLLLLTLVVAGCEVTRAGYATAAYRVERSAGAFEIRDYPALTLVQTPMTPGGDGEGFRRLFHFIQGDNQKQQKIAMTTPVFMAAVGTNQTMAFVLPDGIATNQAPVPSNPQVTVTAFPPGRYAVMRFSGNRSAAREAASLTQLQSWLQAAGYAQLGRPVYGYFDPPWIPGWWRRNEVMILIAQPQ